MSSEIVHDDALLAALSTVRDRGAIGEASLPAAIEHATRFVALIRANAIVVDLGSGGGLPGLVIAARRPDVQLTLVERRATRADLLRRAVAVLDLGGRVTVRTADARSLAVSGPQFDTVTARSFGPPLLVARVAAPLCVSGGEAIVSEPPPSAAEVSDRWPTAELAALGWDDLGPVTGLRHLRRR